MSNVATSLASQKAPRPMWQVFAALTAAVVALTFRDGTFAVLGNSTVLSGLIIGAIGAMLVVPGVHVAIASLWKSQRNPRSRRNIYFWWGVMAALLQPLTLISKLGGNG